MSKDKNPDPEALPSIEQAVDAFFDDFDFGEGSERTRLSYRSGARVFIGFLNEHNDLHPDLPVTNLPPSISADFNAWMQSAKHTGPGPDGSAGDQDFREGYSASTRKLYLQSLTRLLRFWWYRDWLTFSPEEETRAREALQIRRSREDRRRIHSRNDQVPPDFGDKMVRAANALPLPAEPEISDAQSRRKVRLESLRTRAIVHVLRATALRASDLCELTKAHVNLARQTGGHLRLEMQKTSLAAHIVLGQNAITAIDAYLKERDDASPWLFIQHGRTGAPAKNRRLSAEAFKRRRRGYGARLGPGSVRRLVVDLAIRAGYDPERDQFVSTHAFRHWHAQRLIDLGASIDQVQAVLGHARAQTTKDVYAPDPNVSQILKWEARIQSLKPGD